MLADPVPDLMDLLFDLYFILWSDIDPLLMPFSFLIGLHEIKYHVLHLPVFRKKVNQDFIKHRLPPVVSTIRVVVVFTRPPETVPGLLHVPCFEVCDHDLTTFKGDEVCEATEWDLIQCNSIQLVFRQEYLRWRFTFETMGVEGCKNL